MFQCCTQYPWIKYTFLVLFFFFFLKADDVEDYEYGMQLNNSESATESDNPGRRKARQINSGKMKIKDNLISYIF